jgi:MHS family alpha-ketoglutarate permease-like MFS transporter
MTPSSAYWMVVIAQTVALIALPFWGRLSDKIGRKKLLVMFAIFMIITQLPLMNLIDNRPWTLLIASTVALVIVAMSGAILSAVMSESFPTKYRTQGIGFAYSISVAVFGGFAPYINDQVIAWGVGWMSSVYIMLLCVATLIATTLLPDNTGVDLNKV